jgi:hypothetical protein
LEAQLDEMKNNHNIAKMKEGIGRMRLLVAGSNQPISRKMVRQIAGLCDELLATIEGHAVNR